MDENICLGIDFGGSGIKGALVDTRNGEVQSERHRIPTPDPATPDAVASTIREIVDHFNYQGNVGVAFPAAILDGIVQNASNIDDGWIGTNAPKLLSEATNCRVEVLNDADAAGLAEMRFGHGKNIHGVGLIVTVGVGLGTALFTNGVLLPNTELGHVYLKKKKKVAEHWASDAIRKQENLSWKKWAKRFGKYLHHLESLFYPELIIIGGGASKKFDKYAQYLKKVKTKIVPAELQNHAGIIGAAVESIETKEQSQTVQS
ncbi:MAG: ROK family protein [Bacteroidales bacterium]